MKYYFSKTLPGTSYKSAIEKTKQALKDNGFGVIAEIDFQKTLKEKLGVDFRRYLILEACSPPDAYKSLSAEDKIGLLLPCNLLVQEKEEGIEVSSIDPEIMLKGIENTEIQIVAKDVGKRLTKAIESL